MTSDGTAKPNRSITVPLPPAWLISQAILVALAAGLVWADREYWHWYAPPRTEFNELRVSVAELDDDMIEVRTVAVAAESMAKGNQGTAKSILGGVDNPELALARMAGGLAVVSLVQSKGGTQSAGSAQGKACIAWFLRGEGSVTDCGFSRADP